MATNWQLLSVDEPASDEEVGAGLDGSSETTSTAAGEAALSPASKRARKRAVAARNKRLAKEQKEGVSTSPLPSPKTENGSSSVVPPPPPTFVEAQPSSSIEARLDAPFVQQQQKPMQPAPSSTKKPELQRVPTMVDDGASSFSTDFEDTSLLVDGDSSSSSSSSEDEQEARPDEQQQQQRQFEPATPRASSRTFTTKASAALQSTAHGALDSVSKSNAVPDAVNEQAEEAQDAVEQDEKTAAALGASQKPVDHGSDHDPTKKWKSIITRTVWTLIMIAGFAALVLLGHAYLIILVIVCQALVFKEISALFDVAAKPVHHHHHHSREHSRSGDKAVSPTRAARDARAKAERERWSKVLSWYFFATTNYFLHGETIIYYFKHIVFVDAYFIPFARHHRFISFMLYVLGFVGFVTNLKRNQLRRQFGLFCWIHMSLLLIVVSSHFIVNNILEGIIWFWVPASLVVMNDIAAYVWGMLFGKTQLIKLSPKKTVEGFVGAFFTTMVFGYFWATAFMRFNYMICPAFDLGSTAFSTITCQPNDVFIWRSLAIPDNISKVLSIVWPVTQIHWAPFQYHAIIMAIFASLVAPFGGFFASGFKRAFNVKDFGDSIPGHGGMTDRMDCQFLMGLFTYVYYSSMIRDNHITVGGVMQTVVSSLSTQEQLELVKSLTSYLAQQGISV